MPDTTLVEGPIIFRILPGGSRGCRQMSKSSPHADRILEKNQASFPEVTGDGAATILLWQFGPVSGVGDSGSLIAGFPHTRTRDVSAPNDFRTSTSPLPKADA